MYMSDAQLVNFFRFVFRLFPENKKRFERNGREVLLLPLVERLWNYGKRETSKFSSNLRMDLLIAGWLM